MPCVYEVYSVVILDRTSTLPGDSFAMACCFKCKRPVQSAATMCADHPEAGTGNRCVAKVAFADHSGSAEAMIYHEALTRFGPMPASATGLSACTRKLRNVP